MRSAPAFISRARRGSPLAFLFVTVFVDMVGYGLVVPLLPFYAREHAPGAALVGVLGSLYAATQFVGGPFLGGLSLMALGLALVALVPFGPLLYPVVGALALGAGLAIPTLTSLISRRVSGREQGKVMGGLQAILSLTLIVGPVIAGLAFDHLGVIDDLSGWDS